VVSLVASLAPTSGKLWLFPRLSSGVGTAGADPNGVVVRCLFLSLSLPVSRPCLGSRTVLVGFGPCCSRGSIWVLEGFLLSSFEVSQGYGDLEWIHIGICLVCGYGCYPSQVKCRRAVRVIPQVALRSVCPVPLCGVPLLGRDRLLLRAIHQ